MVYAYFEIGRHIVEHEQKGDSRAEYGKALLKELSAKLTARFGEGWGVTHLKNIRFFYLTYAETIKSGKHCLAFLQPIETKHFILSWSHYLVLIRIKDATARSFYEIECWSELS